MFFYIVLTLISATSGLLSTANTHKYQQIDVYIYQCECQNIKSHAQLIAISTSGDGNEVGVSFIDLIIFF